MIITLKNNDKILKKSYIFNLNTINFDGSIDISDIIIIVEMILDNSITVTDIDGNVYETVQIGDQLWMAENLKVTHYNNPNEGNNWLGDEISYPSNEDFGSYDEGQYGVYDNDPANADIYGNLYNWAVVNDDRGVCPEGFHVPSGYEWAILMDFLGGYMIAGGKMKETGLEHWSYWSDEITEEATNESGFGGIPGGHRQGSDQPMYTGLYWGMGEHSNYWCSQQVCRLSNYNSNWELYYNSNYLDDGFSVRCVAD